eukprot:gene5336-3806_t
MASESDFFLTHINVNAEFQQHADELMSNARKEHKKINDVVSSFKSKVDKMIDKQRIEYIQAYESHMQDVQRELHTLRDKVNEMANNHTKNERTEKLKAEIIQFKSDALQLETDSDYLRTHMAKTVHKIYTVVCELAVLPQTYEVLAAALTEVAPKDTETTEVNADEEDEFLAYHHSILNWNVGDSQNDNEVE